jgi:outer membrane protein
MKNLSNYCSIIAVCLLLSFSTTTLAQQKIAHVDSEAVVAAMSEYKNAQSELEAYGKILEKQLVDEQKKAQDYYAEVMKNVQQGLLTPKKQKEEEATLQKMQLDIQEQAAEADQKLAEKEEELTKPLFDKFNAALEKVAAANGFSYIIDIKVALYSKGGEDVTSLVKTELGIN